MRRSRKVKLQYAAIALKAHRPADDQSDESIGQRIKRMSLLATSCQ